MLKAIADILTRVFHLGSLFLYFCYQIIISGWVVGWSVIKGYRGENGLMVEYKPSTDSKWALVLLFNLISMTPGSLSVDISEDNSVILVHLLDKEGKDDFYEVTGRIEKMLKRIFSRPNQEKGIDLE